MKHWLTFLTTGYFQLKCFVLKCIENGKTKNPESLKTSALVSAYFKTKFFIYASVWMKTNTESILFATHKGR